ncbi:hypothetical protein K2173_009463 [Erythroxylum novogranatense]|uniref:Uncharacterized protein n=1 Tax=Erythroxylum novogranatense TaxID=1862640 RepID=A0AAV8U402_9ROSI|nr:hypothetical protein K2173_009463 [Erythroxylum novogranatense]
MTYNILQYWESSLFWTTTNHLLFLHSMTIQSFLIKVKRRVCSVVMQLIELGRFLIKFLEGQLELTVIVRGIK